MGCPQLHTKKMHYSTKGVQGLFVGFIKSGVKSYGYGFNGIKKDDEIKGVGNSLDFGVGIYDSRIGKFLNVDPLTSTYPFYSPYQFAGNTTIQAVDLVGEKPIKPKTLFYKISDLDRSDKLFAGSTKKWGYFTFIPAKVSPNQNNTVLQLGTSVGIEWYVDRGFKIGTSTYIHLTEMHWVKYNGTRYN
jgi:hypothetical protein